MSLMCLYLNPALHSREMFGGQQSMEFYQCGHHCLIILSFFNTKIWNRKAYQKQIQSSITIYFRVHLHYMQKWPSRIHPRPDIFKLDLFKYDRSVNNQGGFDITLHLTELCVRQRQPIFKWRTTMILKLQPQHHKETKYNIWLSFFFNFAHFSTWSHIFWLPQCSGPPCLFWCKHDVKHDTIVIAVLCMRVKSHSKYIYTALFYFFFKCEQFQKFNWSKKSKLSIKTRSVNIALECYICQGDLPPTRRLSEASLSVLLLAK